MTFEPDSAHNRHDALLIASHASNDLAPAEAERTERWLRDCRECAALHADLRALTSALATLPKTANAPRDFRLSPAQAARLRGGPWWRRLARSITAPRGIGRPLATAFTTLGLVGILVGSLPVAMLGLTGVPGERTLFSEYRGDGAGNPAPQVTPDDTGAEQVPAAQGNDGLGAYGPGGAPSPDTKDDTAEELATDTTRDAGRAAVSPVIALAAAFLAVGLGLFALRRFGRHLA